MKLLVVLYVVMVLNVLALEVPITGYNCAHHDTKIVQLDTSQTWECPAPTSLIKSSVRNVTVLHRLDHVTRSAMQCKVEVNARIDGCGWGSHSYPKDSGILKYIQKMTIDECQQYIHTQTFKIGPHTIKNLELNRIYHKSLNYANVEDGGCQDNNVFYLDNKKYVDAYAQLTLTIQYSQIKVIFNVEDNTYELPDTSICHSGFEGCITQDGATVVLPRTKDDLCYPFGTSILYEGVSNVTVSQHQNDLDKNGMVSWNQDGITLYTTLEYVHPTCKYWITSTSALYIMFEDDQHTIKGLQPMSYNEISENHVDTESIYQNARITANTDSVKRLYQSREIDECQANKKRVTEVFRQLSQTIKMKAYELTQQPGYAIFAAGNTALLLKCVPQLYYLRDTALCYQDIPVHGDEGDGFLDITDLTYTTSSKQLICIEEWYTMYNVRGDWYVTTPRVHKTEAPAIYHPKREIHTSLEPVIPPSLSEGYKIKRIKDLHTTFEVQGYRNMYTSEPDEAQDLDEDDHIEVQEAGFSLGSLVSTLWTAAGNLFVIPWWVYCILILALIAVIAKFLYPIVKMTQVFQRVTVTPTSPDIESIQIQQAVPQPRRRSIPHNHRSRVSGKL